MLLLSYFCNFDCTYCYQRDFRRKVERFRFLPGDIDRIFTSYQPILCPRVDPAKICYVLYGGEPLLPRNRDAVIRTLLWATEQGSTVEAITNGYYLDCFLGLLGTEVGKISQVQISFDADRWLHDRNRVLKTGGPTFEKILFNLTNAIKTQVAIQIRIHMHTEGGSAITSFLALLKKRDILRADNIQVFVSPIKRDFSTRGGDLVKERCLSHQDLMELAPSIGSDAARCYKALCRLSSAETGRGPANTAYCMRSKSNCYVIDPIGGIYACYEEAGRPEFRVATYDESGLTFLPYRQKTLSDSIGCRDSSCISPVSLITGGGCAVTARRIHSSHQQKCQDDEDRECVTVALRHVVPKVVAGFKIPEKPPAWLPINYVQDGDRSLPALIDRFSQLDDRSFT